MDPGEFGSVSFFFRELSEIPQKLKGVEGFPNILDLFLILFPFFGSVSSYFLGQFPVFKKSCWSVSSLFFDPFPVFRKSFIKSQFVDQFPLLGPVPLFWVHFLIFLVRFRFSKNRKFSVWWSVSSILGSISSFFGSVSGFQKSSKFSICWSISSFFWGRFLFFGFVSGF